MQHLQKYYEDGMPWHWPSLHELLRDRALPFYLLVLFCAAIALFAVIARASIDHDASVAHYRRESHEWTESSKNLVEMKFTQIYQGLRTLARLPGVRKIDRLGREFDLDAHESAQEIYNNLALNVDVSEVYIVPLGFDPDRINIATGKPEEPIIQFDSQITSRKDGKSRGYTATNERLALPAVDVDEVAEEVEIFEYRAMRDQMRKLQVRYPTEKNLKRLSYPSIASASVITCDNTHVDPRHPNDSRRKGIVVSVPFYSADQKLRGMVSAVVRDDVVSSMIRGEQVIRVQGYELTLPARGFKPDTRQLEAIGHAVPDPDRIYSEVFQLQLPDSFNHWTIWSTRSDDDFWAQRDVSASNSIALLGSIGVIGAALLLLTCVRLQYSITKAVRGRNRELELRVIERTASLEKATEEAEAANRAKSAFLASMSHELRTPLNAIIGFSSLIAEELHGPIADQRYIGYANDAKAGGDHLLAIINDILELSKVEAGKLEMHLEPVSVEQFVGDAVVFVSGAADKSEIRLAGLPLDASIELLLDRRKITQVLINLLSNAIKFTPSGGTVSVQVSARDDGECVISVTDTGIGMSEEQIPVALSPFGQIETAYTRKHQGTGLGLPLSKRFVEAMGGQLELSSKPNVGTSVELRFPRKSLVRRGRTRPATAASSMKQTVT